MSSIRIGSCVVANDGTVYIGTHSDICVRTDGTVLVWEDSEDRGGGEPGYTTCHALSNTQIFAHQAQARSLREKAAAAKKDPLCDFLLAR